MIIDQTQRWRDRRSSYRPAGETIQTSSYEVAEILEDKIAKAFVERHHYSASYPAARFRFGLYRGEDLEGVAVFSVPTNDAALSKWIPGEAAERVELGRLVLLDQVRANGESWFVARAFELLRAKGLAGVLSFADPVERTDAAGATVFPGHLGIIYRALNARYYGRATARTLRLLPDGRAVSPRALQKIRAQERGWRYAVEDLVAAGAAPLQAGQDARAWVREQLPRVTRPLRHAGNLRYVWPLRRDVARLLPAGLAYPTRADLASV